MRHHESTFLTIVALVVLGLSGPIHAESKTIRLTPPPWQPGGCSTTDSPTCGYASAEDPAKLVVALLQPRVSCVWFPDPVPPLSKVTLAADHM